MVHFFEYVYRLKVANTGKNKVISHIKMLLSIAVQENWANITQEKLIYREDRLHRPRNIPRFIPNHVLVQLNQHLNELFMSQKHRFITSTHRQKNWRAVRVETSFPD